MLLRAVPHNLDYEHVGWVDITHQGSLSLPGSPGRITTSYLYIGIMSPPFTSSANWWADSHSVAALIYSPESTAMSESSGFITATYNGPNSSEVVIDGMHYVSSSLKSLPKS